MQPRTPPAPPQAWADLPKVLDLAKRPNVVIKVSGACTLSQKPYPLPDIWDPLARIFDARGFERGLRDTDWTRAFAVVNHEQAVEPFQLTDWLNDDERAMLMGGACAKAHGWMPEKEKQESTSPWHWYKQPPTVALHCPAEPGPCPSNPAHCA